MSKPATKKKGQVVPKWLVKSLEKKAQHLVKFGCDVKIYRGAKKVVAISEGCIFYIPYIEHVLKKKNQVRVKGFHVSGVHVILFNK